MIATAAPLRASQPPACASDDVVSPKLWRGLAFALPISLAMWAGIIMGVRALLS